jgi:polysaccharide export outer membrane protein
MSQVKIPSATLFVRLVTWLLVIAGALIVTACTTDLPAPPTTVTKTATYHIGPGDALNVFVWQNTDLTTAVTVRPDGRISLPLVNDIVAAGKTPTQLANIIQSRLKKYVEAPIVTVMVNSFVGQYSEQIRVVGEAVKPQAIPYRKGMTALDAMISAGGLTQYAAGDRAKLIRKVDGEEMSYRLQLGKLLKDGDISANVSLDPGDVIIIPQTYF